MYAKGAGEALFGHIHFMRDEVSTGSGSDRVLHVVGVKLTSVGRADSVRTENGSDRSSLVDEAGSFIQDTKDV